MLCFGFVPSSTGAAGRWWALAALLITAFAAFLRLDAFTGKYGELEHPTWARIATHDIAPRARWVQPSAVQWQRVPTPYVGGDPIAYLRYAREMTTFYQPHVREPVYLATTRAALWLLDNQDAAISFASAAGSVAAVFATYLLGAAAVSPAGGLIAAGLLAIEYEAIGWSVEGWRDDTFTALFVLTAWALVRLREAPSFWRAVAAGLCAGAVCLTRITALSFVLPALGWMALERSDGRSALRPQLAVASLLLAAVVAPYLASCAIATGDPFFAINEHTRYYRFAEGASATPTSTTAYLFDKFARHPIGMIDVAAVGLFVRPFTIKWHLYDLWVRGASTFLAGAALAGLAAWLFTGRGRFLLLLLVTALVPYAFTWNVGGGGEWRFTMHVYSIYLIAAAAVFVAAGRALRAALRRDQQHVQVRVLLRRAAVVAAGCTVAAALYVALPWFVQREVIANGEAADIKVDPRDWPFYRNGWSESHTDGAVTARVSTVPIAVVHFPLPLKRAYEIVLRLDPAAPEAQHRFTVLLNKQLIGTLLFGWNAERVGAYRLTLPATSVRAGDNEIAVVPDTMVTAADAGRRLDWLDPRQRVGVRLWYLRVLDQR
jgi:hypothetical protein